MDYSWFNEKFIKTCLNQHVEPVMANGVLILTYAEPLPPEMKKRIETLIPLGQEVYWREGVRNHTMAALGYALGMAGLEINSATFSDRRLKLHLINKLAIIPDAMIPNEFWGSLVCILEKDPYIKSYEIILNGQKVLDSTAGPVVADDRFSYDREYLPKDVAIDIRILLETTSSVDEFLEFLEEDHKGKGT